MLASAVVCAENCKCAKEHEERPGEKGEPIVPSEVFDQGDTAVYTKGDGDSRKGAEETDCAQQLWAASTDGYAHIDAS